MSAEDWLRAAKTEERRLLDEIAKTDLYKQLHAVRTVIAVYGETAESNLAASTDPGATVGSTRGNGSTPKHGFKTASVFSEVSEPVGDVRSWSGGSKR